MRSILKNSFIVTLLIVLGKLISFVRDIFISKVYGATDSTDAFFVANNIPTIIYTAFITSSLMFFIPIYVDKKSKYGIKDSNQFASNTWNIMFVISVLLTVIGILIAPFLCKIAAPGFVDEKLRLTITMSRWMVLSFPLTLTIILFSNLQNANQHFIIAQLTALSSALFVIIGIYCFSDTLGIFAVIYSLLFGSLFNAILQRIASVKYYKHIWSFDYKSDDFKKMCMLAIPVFIGLTADEINIFINGMICSKLENGSVSFFNYAQRLLQTINGTCISGVIIVIYPLLSEFASSNNIDKIKEFINNSVRGAFVYLLPVAFVILLYSKDIVTIVFFRGNFTEYALIKTSNVFACYSFSIIFLACRELFNRVFYSLKDAKTPALIGLSSVSINIVLSLLLYKRFQVVGLAISAVFATIFTSIIQYYFIRRKIGTCFSSLPISPSSLFPFLLAVSLLVAPKILFNLVFNISFHAWTNVLFASVSVILYFIVLIIFRFPTVLLIYNSVLKTFSKLKRTSNKCVA